MADVEVRNKADPADGGQGQTESATADRPTPARADRLKGGSRIRATMIALLVIVVVAAGVWAYNKLFVEGYESTDDAKIQGNQAIISSQTLGQIRTLAVDLGDSVSRGQIIATLEDRSQQAQRNQVLNAIEQAKVNLDQARIGASSGRATVQLNEIKLQQARSDLDRATSQLKAELISQEQFEHVKLAADTALASYNIALEQQRLAEAGEKAAAAQIKSMQSQLEAVDASMAHVIITATIDGVVARKWVMSGDVVQPAQAIYTLFDLKNLWVDAYFKETQVRNLRVGDPVTISVDAYQGLKLPGKIERLGVTTAAQFALIPQDNTSGNYTKLTQRVPVRITFSSAMQGGDSPPSSRAGRDSALLPGMSVVVTVRTSKE